MGLLWFIILAIMMTVICSSCGRKLPKINKLSDLRGRTIAFQTGTVNDILLLAAIRDAEFRHFDNIEIAIEDLRNGYIDAIVHKLPILNLYQRNNKDLKILSGMISNADYAFGVHAYNSLLKQRIDRTLEMLKRSGIFEDMTQRWFNDEGTLPKMPEFELDETNGILRLGTYANLPPFSFIDYEGRYAGFDIELAHYVAKDLNMGLEIVNMRYVSLIPSIIANRVHKIGAAIVVDDENETNLRFSKPYLTSGIGVMVRN